MNILKTILYSTAFMALGLANAHAASLSGNYLTSLGFSGGDTTSLSDNQKLVIKAVEAFEAKDFEASTTLFNQAATRFPENYAVNYFLGILKLKAGDKQGAVAEWMTYIDKAPNGENALKIRKNLTILQKIVAKEQAVRALRQEHQLATIPVDPNALAISYFRNLGSNTLDPLQKGMTEMLITDLAQVPGMKVVERVKMQALLEEMQLSQTGLIDTKTQLNFGKLLRADKMVSGAYSNLNKDSLDISSSTVKTANGQELSSASAKGGMQQFWMVEKDLAKNILTDLGYAAKDIPKSVWKPHTKNYTAFQAFSKGLDFEDRNMFAQARAAYQDALLADPDFKLAELAMLGVPIATTSTGAIVISSVSSAPSASAAASSIGLSTTVTGVSTLAIVGGVAGAGAVAAVVGGGGGAPAIARKLRVFGSGSETTVTMCGATFNPNIGPYPVCRGITSTAGLNGGADWIGVPAGTYQVAVTAITGAAVNALCAAGNSWNNMDVSSATTGATSAVITAVATTPTIGAVNQVAGSNPSALSPGTLNFRNCTPTGSVASGSITIP